MYAVEATSMADHACAFVKANNFEHVVEVIQGSVEDIFLPEKGIVFNLVLSIRHYMNLICCYMYSI